MILKNSSQPCPGGFLHRTETILEDKRDALPLIVPLRYLTVPNVSSGSPFSRNSPCARMFLHRAVPRAASSHTDKCEIVATGQTTGNGREFCYLFCMTGDSDFSGRSFPKSGGAFNHRCASCRITAHRSRTHQVRSLPTWHRVSLLGLPSPHRLDVPERFA